MGTCKDEMQKTTNNDKKESKNVFEKLARFKKDKIDIIKEAKTIADFSSAIEEKMINLIENKTKELESEKGREDYNRRQLGRLELMYYLIIKFNETAAEYGEDN